MVLRAWSPALYIDAVWCWVFVAAVRRRSNGRYAPVEHVAVLQQYLVAILMHLFVPAQSQGTISLQSSRVSEWMGGWMESDFHTPTPRYL